MRRKIGYQNLFPSTDTGACCFWLPGWCCVAVRTVLSVGTSTVLALKSRVMGSQGRLPDASGDALIVLLTRDVRPHDQPALAAACGGGHQVIPQFVYDPALLNRATAAPYRLPFLVDSLHDLRRSLTKREGR
jgi:DNA photolyase